MNINTYFRNKSFTAGFIIILAFVVLSIISAVDLKLLTPYNPYSLNFSEANLPPSFSHPFGTDQEGRDVLARVLAALPIDITIPLVVVGLSLIVGSIIGIIAGYMGKLADEILMRITDIFLAFPGILLALAISEVLGESHLSSRLYYSELALVVVNWPIYARLVRAQTLQVKNMQFITLAKVAGLNNIEILRKHIVPHLLPLIIVYSTLDMGTVILSYSILAFFGLGAPPPTPELGRMVYDGLEALPQNWWSSTFPAIVITLLALGFSLAGDGLRDILDPRVGGG